MRTPPAHSTTILISAGETSGDRYGAGLVPEIRELLGERVHFFGVGGKGMAAAGVPGFKASTFAAGCRKYAWRQLSGGFRELLAADHAFKSSSPNPEAYFDILLWKLVA